MSIKVKMLILSTSILINQNIFADTNNKVLVSSTEEIDAYILTNTIKIIKPETFQYWAEYVYKKNIEENGTIEYKKDEHSKSLIELDCRKESLKELSEITYAINGSTKGDTVIKPNEIETQYIVPESLGAIMQEVICKN